MIVRYWPKADMASALAMSVFRGIADIDPLPPTTPVAPYCENKSRQRHRYNQILFKVAVVVAVRNDYLCRCRVYEGARSEQTDQNESSQEH
jgi:hypothetical protein